MNDLQERVIELPPRRVINERFRDIVRAAEAWIESIPGHLGEDPFPLKHTFAEGVYIRELFIPKGYFLVGKLHRDSYASFILSGDMSVLTEEGVRRVKGPCWNVAPEGIKRFGFSHEDTVWVTVHPNPENITDIDILEDRIHAKDYDDLPQIIDAHKCVEVKSFMKEVLFDVDKFRELTKEIFAHEKDGFWSDWTKEQQDLYISGDWEAFSRSRGYTEQEIDALGQWINMKESAEQFGLNPLEDILDLSIAVAEKNSRKDKNGEILLSSHVPSSKKIAYIKGEKLCQIQ